MKQQLLNASKIISSDDTLTRAMNHLLPKGISASTHAAKKFVKDDDIAACIALAAAGVPLCHVPENVAHRAVVGLKKLLATKSEAGEALFERAEKVLAAVRSEPPAAHMKKQVLAKLRETIAVLEAAPKMAVPPQAEMRSKNDFQRLTKGLRPGDTITIFFTPPNKATMKSRKEVVKEVDPGGAIWLEQTRRRSPTASGGPSIGFDIRGPYYAASMTGKHTDLHGLAKGVSQLVPADPVATMGPAMASANKD